LSVKSTSHLNSLIRSSASSTLPWCTAHL